MNTPTAHSRLFCLQLCRPAGYCLSSVFRNTSSFLVHLGCAAASTGPPCPLVGLRFAGRRSWLLIPNPHPKVKIGVCGKGWDSAGGGGFLLLVGCLLSLGWGWNGGREVGQLHQGLDGAVLFFLQHETNNSWANATEFNLGCCNTGVGFKGGRVWAPASKHAQQGGGS